MTWLKEDFAEAVLKLTAFGLNTRAREKYLAGASGWEKSRQALRAQDPGPLIDCWASLTTDYREVLAQIDVPSMLVYGGKAISMEKERLNSSPTRFPTPSCTSTKERIIRPSIALRTLPHDSSISSNDQSNRT